MDIQKLMSFLVLSKEKNFTKAADSLYISQPALSNQIKSLESELGVYLFNRIGKKSFLTIEGEHFLEYAEDMVTSYLNAVEHIRQIENLEHGNLNFGATHFIGIYILPQIISEFQKIYPNIKINMRIGSSKEILEQLDKNRLEFVFLSDYIKKSDSKYVSNFYCDDDLKLIVGKNHRLFNKNSCSLYDLENEIFLNKGPNSSIYKFVKRKFNDYNFKIKNDMVVSDQEAIKESVINNIGISIISTKAIQKELKLGLLKSLDIEEFEISRKIIYVYEHDRHLTPAAKEFFKLL